MADIAALDDAVADPAIGAVLARYFDGIYTGDIDTLRSAFHPDAILWGDVRGKPYRKVLDEYLDAVRDRIAPRARGEAFGMRPISVEAHGPIALAKVSCKMLGFDYLDFLSLVKREGSWAIVAKVFTDLPPED